MTETGTCAPRATLAHRGGSAFDGKKKGMGFHSARGGKGMDLIYAGQVDPRALNPSPRVCEARVKPVDPGDPSPNRRPIPRPAPGIWVRAFAASEIEYRAKSPRAK